GRGAPAGRAVLDRPWRRPGDVTYAGGRQAELADRQDTRARPGLAADDGGLGSREGGDPARWRTRRESARLPPAALRARSPARHDRGPAHAAAADRGHGRGGHVRSLQRLDVNSQLPTSNSQGEPRAAFLGSWELGVDCEGDQSITTYRHILSPSLAPTYLPISLMNCSFAFQGRYSLNSRTIRRPAP